jgi:hypothetical protein
VAGRPQAAADVATTRPKFATVTVTASAAADSAAKVAAEPTPGRLDSVQETRKMSVAENAARAPTVGGVARAEAAAAAPAPRARTERAFSAKAAALSPVSFAGCYIVTADPSTGLPRRLSLDTTRVASPQTLQRQTLADAVVVDRFTMSALSEVTGRPLEPATWELRPDGVVRLSIGAPARNADLRPLSGGLVGSMTIGDRAVSVMLQPAGARDEGCGPR